MRWSFAINFGVSYLPLYLLSHFRYWSLPCSRKLCFAGGVCCFLTFQGFFDYTEGPLRAATKSKELRQEFLEEAFVDLCRSIAIVYSVIVCTNIVDNCTSAVDFFLVHGSLVPNSAVPPLKFYCLPHTFLFIIYLYITIELNKTDYLIY